MALVNVEGVFYATVLVGERAKPRPATKWASIPACSGIDIWANLVFRPPSIDVSASVDRRGRTRLIMPNTMQYESHFRRQDHTERSSKSP
jgi:hypothetical protein